MADPDELDPNHVYPTPAEQEAERRANDLWVDSDGDGVDDKTEVARGLDPLAPDTDDEGLLDGQELVNTGYSAVAVGSGDEWLVGDVDFTYEARSNPKLKDTDGDGLEDAEEFEAKSDPFKRDTDGDRLLDGEEVHKHGSNPTMRDTDGLDGDDFAEVQAGGNPAGLTEAQKQVVAEKVASNPDAVAEHLRHSISPAAAPAGPNALGALTNAGVDVSNVGSAPPSPTEGGPNALRALTDAGVDVSNIGSEPQVAEPSPSADQPPAPPDAQFGSGVEGRLDVAFGGGASEPGEDSDSVDDDGAHLDIEPLVTRALSHADSAGDGRHPAADNGSFASDDGFEDRGGDNEPSADYPSDDDADNSAADHAESAL